LSATEGNSVLVVGVGVNNRPLLRYWRERGARVVAADRAPADQFPGPLDADVEWCLGPDYLEEALRIGPYAEVYVTPGMPKDHPVLRRLEAAGSRLTCETDLFLRQCPAPVLGITGSAGKTTTTTLLGSILRADGSRPTFVGGNIGRSLLPDLPRIGPDSWVVMELSSFQLELTTVSPHGAAVLNIAPNHLDVHKTFAAYVDAKAHIFREQTASDWLVLPDPPPPSLVPALTAHRGRRLAFSTDHPVARGAYVDGDWIVWAGGGPERRVLPTSAWQVPGRMNLANACAAATMALAAGARLEAVGEALAAFRGVPHRLEPVRDVGGVRYVNDSIATSPDRTLAALEAISGPLVVICGGYDKHLDYGELGRALTDRARVVILLGQTAEKIARALGPGPAVFRVASLDEAVATAAREARPGETVLLSPASASYDMFRNFEERGERFRALVEAL
jgi:UDP-N-acetylmuramoylalanine--D-glutamate ligase